MSIRIDHATVLAHLNDGPGVLRDHSILIEGHTIRALGPTATDASSDSSTKSRPPQPGAAVPHEVIDASKHIVLPGFVNTHHHLYQSLTRCMKGVQNAGLFDWLTAL